MSPLNVQGSAHARWLKLPLLLLLALLAGGAGAADEFARYPADRALVGRPARPDVAKGRARRYRTVLREAAREGPNFNGHYRVAWWGCGTNCIEWAVIDLRTGKVWFPSSAALSCWSTEGDEGAPDWFEMRTTSKLLYLHVCDPAPNGSRTFNRRLVYVWAGSRMKLLRTETLR
jgi:hypothetical protein